MSQTILPIPKLKVFKNIRAPLCNFNPDDSWFCRVHIDLSWSWSVSQGFTYIPTLIKRFFCWPEVIPLIIVSNEYVAHALVSGWILGYTVHTTITTVSGRKFECYFPSQLAKYISAKRTHTTSCSPASNEGVGEFHPMLKAAFLKASTSYSIPQQLPHIRSRTAVWYSGFFAIIYACPSRLIYSRSDTIRVSPTFKTNYQ